METRRNGVEKSITNHKWRNKIGIINKTYKPQASQSKKDKFISNESNNNMSLDKYRSLYKSRASQRTET